MSLFDRDNALDFLKEYVKTERLLKHSYAVEGAMINYAKIFSEDESKWGCCGLLHDIDFEMHPELHPNEGIKWLADKGYEEDFVLAIKGHADENTSRDTQMAKTLYAVDELASFIVAVALVRPTKFEGLKVKSVNKKLKDKGFAAAVNRDGIRESVKELGIELSDHIQNVIDGLVAHEEVLNSYGASLVK